VEPLIEARQIVKRYRETDAVRGIDFTVRRGECFGILGPNGAGKTSIIKMLYNLVRRDGGELLIDGRDPQVHPVEVKSRMGVVPQEDNLDPDLNVLENLEIYSNYFALRRGDAEARMRELCRFFELEHKKGHRVQELSGGMKRRLVIIRALLNAPELLLLDEPTTGLDPAARHLIWDKIRDLKKRGITAVLTTHYMEEASNLCDRILIMDRGRIILEGRPRSLVERHFEKYVLETQSVSIDWDLADLRHESYGNRHFFYSDDEKRLFSLSECFGSDSIILRNATLEDLFLRKTGRRFE
jgi:lipooligosaccharide transport system ATP-binding protein